MSIMVNLRWEQNTKETYLIIFLSLISLFLIFLLTQCHVLLETLSHFVDIFSMCPSMYSPHRGLCAMTSRAYK